MKAALLLWVGICLFGLAATAALLKQPKKEPRCFTVEGAARNRRGRRRQRHGMWLRSCDRLRRRTWAPTAKGQ